MTDREQRTQVTDIRFFWEGDAHFITIKGDWQAKEAADLLQRAGMQIAEWTERKIDELDTVPQIIADIKNEAANDR